jgi:hypothetical protein
MNQEDKIKELENKYKFERLEKQLFIGKVSEIIGDDKTIELLKESKDAIEQIKKI